MFSWEARVLHPKILYILMYIPGHSIRQLSIYSMLAVTTTTPQKGHVFTIPKRATNRRIARSSHEFNMHFWVWCISTYTNEKSININRYTPKAYFVWHLKMGTPFIKGDFYWKPSFFRGYVKFCKGNFSFNLPLSFLHVFDQVWWRQLPKQKHLMCRYHVSREKNSYFPL